jgi:ribosomal protein S18 acetylase RimI-like enzyme
MSADTKSAVLTMLLSAGDGSILGSVAEDVFDHPVRMDLVAEFLSDPRHHIAVALDGGIVVGMASAVHYIHPDKPAQLFINEVGVAPSHQRQGIASELIARLLAHGRVLGCTEAWVAADEDNAPARALYAHVGGQEEPVRAVIYTFPLASVAAQRPV